MSKRSRKLSGDIGLFLKQYQRKAQRGQEPNDRGYDREIEGKIKALSPEELSEYMSGDGEEWSLEEENAWRAGENPRGVGFSLNDAVKLKKSKGSAVGAVVSLLRVRPVPKYIVELSNRVEVEVFQNEIDLINT